MHLSAFHMVLTLFGILLKDIQLVEEFYGKLKNAGFTNLLSLEIVLDTLAEGESLRGCGMAILNPPWQFEAKMSIIFAKIDPIFRF